MTTPSSYELYEKLSWRWNDLKRAREPWLNWWKDIADYISPFSGRFDVHDHGQDRNFDLIYCDDATNDLNILVAGMASGTTSPLRPWFRLVPPRTDLTYDYSAQTYLSNLQHILLKLFQASNTYNSLHQLFKEICLFGAAADLIYDDLNNIIAHHVLTAGEYCIAVDDKGAVDTLYREFELTVSQAVKMFGYKNLSREIQDAHDRGRLEDYFKFIHAIEPRVDRDHNSRLGKDKPWGSWYFEEGTSNHKVVRESGFDYFPALCPRWDVNSHEAYGISPCLNALPDVKQLQLETLRKQELIENYVNPAVMVPNSARQEPIDLSPGALNYIPATGQDQAVKPIISSMGDLQAITQDIAEIKESIKQKFFVDLFLMLQSFGDNRKTATEVHALKEEKMLVLGPVIERLGFELQRPLINISIAKLQERGLLPPPPPSMAQQGMTIEFQGVLAQSQRAVDINSIDRFISSMQAMAATDPSIIDRLDPDGVVDIYSDRLAIDPHMLRSREDAQEIRSLRAQQMQAQAQAEQAAQLGQTANSLAQAQATAADASMATQNLDPVAGGSLGGIM